MWPRETRKCQRSVAILSLLAKAKAFLSQLGLPLAQQWKGTMPSNHPRINTLPADLFAGLQSFRELEERISALPDGGLLRGDALEVFVEAHLQISPLFQVEELWLVNQIPLSVRRQLKLPSDSKGIDGVYRKRDGSLAPYQVKFRQGRPQVGVGDTSSFFMLTENAEQRVLISNCDRYAKEIRNRDNLLIVGGTYFDELAGEDFAQIEKWLKNKRVTPRRERPMRVHQAKAVEAIVKQMQAEARTTAVMPCGTGKTLVGLRAVEALKPANVIVFVPSLALLAQLLEDWAKDTIWGERFRYLCVCSQPAVSAEVDRWELSPTDVHFPVTTDSAVVRRFLKHDSDKDITRVIFSTYQSANKLADGMPRGFRFDVGLFDEAHKTTESGFTLALHDKNLPIDRRLFLTATPRHIDIKHRDKQGDFKVVSMDNPEIYGQRAFSQSFPEAVEEGIICDYRVVVATVDRSEVSEYAERYGITLVQGDENATRWVASQIAVTRAIEETGASKVITFHSRVRQAEDFASKTSRGIGQFLPDFGVGHVNGTQPVTDRKDVLSGFRGDGKMLVTNARCLTEGVDLPAVDAVVFNNPRRSKVDIVQAVGRAMRKPPHSNKELGYVVIPILLEHNQTDDLEEACRGTAWEDLVAVLAALRDHDSRLDEIIREAQETAGRGENFDPRPFGDKITILGRPQIPLSIIQRHVGAVILERLGQTWDYRYGQLRAFKEQHGHCNVSFAKQKDRALYVWLINQRQLKRRGELATDRLNRLEDLGVDWQTFDSRWSQRFADLEKFHARYGHCDVPQSGGQHNSLGKWLNQQRTAKRSGKLPEQREKQLSSLGVVWDPLEAGWRKQFRSLERFKSIHGHCRVPFSYSDDPRLSAWLRTQRRLQKHGKMSASRAAQLDALGMEWDTNSDVWEQRFKELKEYKRHEGHTEVPASYKENRALAMWVSTQRRIHKSNQLTAERKRRLESIGFLWEPNEASWKRQFAKLRSFKERHGHCNVPLRCASDPELGRWLSNQRHLMRSRKLAKYRAKKLTEIGVVWHRGANAWDSKFAALVSFKRKHGHCNVPQREKENGGLGQWLSKQRRDKKKGTLPKDKADRLEKVGVKWDALEDLWQTNLASLQRFHKRHGHCSPTTSTHAELSLWVQMLRRLRKCGKLPQERIAQLNKLGMVWDPLDIAWEEKFRALSAFKKRYGHCNVPSKFKGDPELGSWLVNQRQRRRLGKLPIDRFKRLDSLGVNWNASRSKARQAVG